MKITSLKKISFLNLFKAFIFIHILFQFDFASAQDNNWVNIKGVIKSCSTGKPVDEAYLVVKKGSNKDYVFLSSKEGEYHLSYPNLSSSDSAQISHIGFVSQFFSVNKLMENPTICLSEQIYELSELTVKNRKTKSYEIGNKKDISIHSTSCSYNSIVALYIENPGYKAKIVKAKVRFGKLPFIDVESENNIPIRIRLFSVKPDIIFPDRDLIQDTLLVALTPGENWLAIDLSGANISIPPNGIFLAIEVLPFDFYFSRNLVKNRFSNGYGNGPVISASLPIKSGETQSFIFLNVSNDGFNRSWNAFESQKRDFMMKLIVNKVDESK